MPRILLNTFLIILVTTLLIGCAEPPPQNINNACDMLKEKKSWYRAAAHSQHRWGIPIEVMLAFIHQESSFRSKAKPPRKELLGFIPWFRTSSAKGYAQAVDQSWKEYKKENNRWFARRTSFKDSIDFIGWYNHKSVQQLNLVPHDAYSLYLAYHEGRGGFSRKSYQQKDWLIKVARKVQRRSAEYRKQLHSCTLEKSGSWLSRLLHGS